MSVLRTWKGQQEDTVVKNDTQLKEVSGETKSYIFFSKYKVLLQIALMIYSNPF